MFVIINHFHCSFRFKTSKLINFRIFECPSLDIQIFEYSNYIFESGYFLTPLVLTTCVCFDNEIRNECMFCISMKEEKFVISIPVVLCFGGFYDLHFLQFLAFWLTFFNLWTTMWSSCFAYFAYFGLLANFFLTFTINSSKLTKIPLYLLFFLFYFQINFFFIIFHFIFKSTSSAINFHLPHIPKN